MTEVAVAIAVAAAALALVLLSVVVRQGRALRDLSGRLDETMAALEATREQGELLLTQHQETTAALEAALSAADPFEPETNGDDRDVTVITDISDWAADEPSTARIASVTLGGPLIKVAAFGHGVRRALDEEQRMRISYAVRKELRRQRKMRRRRRAEQARSRGWG